jgi:prolyl oligopeptidase
MKKSYSLLLFLICCWTVNELQAQTKFSPPATPAIPVTDTLHGMQLTDNYRWLEEKTDQKVIYWICSATINF